MNEKINNFRDLNIWKLGVEMVVDVERENILEKLNHITCMIINLIKHI